MNSKNNEINIPSIQYNKKPFTSITILIENIPSSIRLQQRDRPNDGFPEFLERFKRLSGYKNDPVMCQEEELAVAIPKRKTDSGNWKSGTILNHNDFRIGCKKLPKNNQCILNDKQLTKCNRTFNFATLLSKEPNKILDAIVAHQYKFEESLKATKRPNDFVLIIEVLSKFCLADTNVFKINILSTVLNSKFTDNLVSYILKIFIQTPEERLENNLFWCDLNKFWNDLLTVCETFYTYIAYSSCDILQKLVQATLTCISNLTLLRGEMRGEDKFKDILQMIQSRADLKHASPAEKPLDDLQQPEPPNNFRFLSLYPTREDIVSKVDLFLRPNITKGPYKNVDHYLDVQVRLLREDFVSPLRESVSEYMSASDGIDSGKVVPIHRDVKFLEYERVRDKIGLKIKFNKTNFANDKQLMFGSLVCFTRDNFGTVIFGTILNQDKKYLSKGECIIQLTHNNKILFNVAYVMIESEVYFEPYHKVLMALKSLRSSNFPLTYYIVHAESVIKRPKYITSNESYENQLRIYSLTMDKIENSDNKQLDLLKFNKSQFKAFYRGLTSEFAIIQGPPGTGKTYVGLELVQTLLTAFPEKTILVVCCTNHALDQFLEKLLAYTKKLVRLGGQSKNKDITEFTLKEYKFKIKLYHRVLRYEHWLENRSRRKRQNFDEFKTYYCRDQSMLDEYDFMRYLKDYYSDDVDNLHINTLRTFLENLGSDWMCKLYNASNRYSNEIREMLSELKDENKEFSKLQNELNIINSGNGIVWASSFDIYDLAAFKKMYKFPTREIISETDNMKIVESWIMGDDLREEKYVIHDYVKEMNENLEPNEEDDEYLIYNFDSEENEDIDKDGADQGRSRYFTISTSYFEEMLIELDCEIQELPFQKWDDTDCYILILNEKEFELREKMERIKRKIKYMQNRLIQCKRNFDQNHVNTLNGENPYSMNLEERWAYYQYQLHTHKGNIRRRLINNLRMQNNVCSNLYKQFDNVQQLKDIAILENMQVIGMTTTAAAQKHSLLQALKCPIVVVEEAAEILESHVIASLTKECQHLIFIGDHKQLRPSTADYQLAKKYYFDVSLFERMVNNGLQCNTLTVQHRMRPEIASLISPIIYPDLENHPTVSEYPQVLGVDKNLFFVNHDKLEDGASDSTSKRNKHEAGFLIELARYFILQGYKPEDVTILTAYAGQLLEITKLQRKYEIMNEVRVENVDNYQGEECKIILLSLVRSNTQNRMGYLSIENRVCVALSRAKEGLFIIGNMNMLSSNCSIWSKVRKALEQNNSLNASLRLRCQNHPEIFTLVSNERDFAKVPEGGCSKICSTIMDCGHECARFCHLRSENDTFCNRCTERNRCSNCFTICGPCLVPQKVGTGCGHEAVLACKDAQRYLCEKIVKKEFIWCQHINELPCYVDIRRASCSHDCKEVLWPCGHECVRKCHVAPTFGMEHYCSDCNL